MWGASTAACDSRRRVSPPSSALDHLSLRRYVYALPVTQLLFTGREPAVPAMQPMDPARPSTYSALQEPEYNEWPPIDEALLARCRASLNHNLSSVLNGPDTVQESFWNPADLAIMPRADIPESFFEDLLPFYGQLKSCHCLWRWWIVDVAVPGRAPEAFDAQVERTRWRRRARR